MAKDKEKRVRGIVYNFNPEFPHPLLKIEDLQPAIVDSVFIAKKGDRVLVERFDCHDWDLKKDKYTLDICTVMSFDEPNWVHDHVTVDLFDDTRGDNYGIDPKNPPRCGILTDEHLKKTRGKKKRQRRMKNEEPIVDAPTPVEYTIPPEENVTNNVEPSE